MRLLVVALLLIATVNATRTQNKLKELFNSKEWKSLFPKAVIEDSKLLVPDIIIKYKYPVEIHTVETTDGYKLEVHRIPYGKNGSSKKKQSSCGSSQRKPIVFLQHGLLCSSADWILTGPKTGLAYLLADRGYDVWMGNARGNRYSRAHSSWDDTSEQFWDFSWHEIGTIDLPAMIDFALNCTGEKNIFYIGHSQGTTVFYVMASEKPEYNNKIRAQFSLAPVAYMSNLPLNHKKFFRPAIHGYYYLMGSSEFLPSPYWLEHLTKALCKNKKTFFLCGHALFAFTGYNEKQFNKTFFPILLEHYPAGSSTKQVVHYAQEIKSGKFCQYDYEGGNLLRYGSWDPPEYKLSKITARVYLLYSNNDNLSGKKDVMILNHKLKNAKTHLIIDRKWNHMDYLYGINATEFVYNKIFELMKFH